MKKAFVLLMVMLAARWLPAQGTTAPLSPLLLLTNGPGCIPRYCSGQMLQPGQRYFIGARPNQGSTFLSWQQIKKDVEVKTVIYPSGPIVITTNTVVTMGKNNQDAWMSFVMEPTTVKFRNDNPGTSIITESKGWQANFAPGYSKW